MSGAMSVASSVASVLRRTWGSAGDQVLRDTPQRRCFRAFFGSDVGSRSLVDRVKKVLSSSLAHEYSQDALAEAEAYLENALDGQDLVALAVRAAGDRQEVKTHFAPDEEVRRLWVEGTAGLVELMLEACLTFLVELLAQDPESVPAVGVANLKAVGVVQKKQEETNAEVRKIREGIESLLVQHEVGEPIPEVLVPLLSEPRIQRFRELAGSQEAALRLYQWNMEMSAEVYTALHLVEVLLRNSIDRALRPWNASQTGVEGADLWALRPCERLERTIGTDLVDARKRAREAFQRRPKRNRPANPTHDHVVAQCTFITWDKLLPRRHKRRAAGRHLWRQSLNCAFPNLDKSNTEAPFLLADAVARLREVRNRVAHLEPLLSSQENRQTYDDVSFVLGAIAPEAKQWFESRQRITKLLRDRRYPKEN